MLESLASPSAATNEIDVRNNGSFDSFPSVLRAHRGARAPSAVVPRRPMSPCPRAARRARGELHDGRQGYRQELAVEALQLCCFAVRGGKAHWAAAAGSGA